MFTKLTVVFVSSLLTAGLATANEVAPRSKKEMFELGQTMIECAAFFKVLASLPPAKDSPNTGQLSEDKATGWQMAGTFWLLGGSSGDAELHVRETADAIVELKKTEYLSLIEMKGAPGFNDLGRDFQTKCMPLVPMQEATLRSLRSGN
jgi:hypothetical protein